MERDTRLEAYLERIGEPGPVAADLATLRRIHRAHLRAITYENLDIHLGREIALDEERFFAKLVGERRGGWCYEMNGLFAAMLRRIGFAVRLLATTVNRDRPGLVAADNHLALLVELERPYLADVGFGNGLQEPIPLEPGAYEQGGFRYELARDGERWFFHNFGRGEIYDFTLEPRQLADFAHPSRALQTDPASGFVRVATCHRWTEGAILSLRGAVLQTVTPAGATEETIADAARYESLIRETFGLAVDDLDGLWRKVRAAHEAWAAQQAAA
ncbi:MAG TPA: arylamine N-acetyltransferase [Herpetosiphonaceae bacterium]